MQAITSCAQGPSGKDACWKAVELMRTRNAMEASYWTNKVEASGGKTGTKNTDEKN